MTTASYQSVMVVAGMTSCGSLLLIKIPKNVLKLMQPILFTVLGPYLEEYLQKLYLNEMNRVIFHHDKAPSHTAKLLIILKK